MGKLILFDIDGTLFNPENFGRLIRAEFTKILNTTEEELMRANADYYAKLESTTDFNPHDMAAHIALVFGADSDVLDRVFWENTDIYKQSVYEDVPKSLARLSLVSTLGIFSQGNVELQNRKIDCADIRKYLSGENIYIHARKLNDEVLADIPRGAVIVDDNHEVVVKMASVTEAIWINRKTSDNDSSIRTIHSLNELV